MDCAEFLRWALPLLGFRWEGYKKVHRQVCKRITPLMREAGLEGFDSYKTYLEDHPGEMKVLDSVRDHHIAVLPGPPGIRYPSHESSSLARGECHRKGKA